MPRAIAPCLVAMVSFIGLVGCESVSGEAESPPGQSPSAPVSYYLPKVMLDVQVSYELAQCKASNGRLDLSLIVVSSVTSAPERDDRSRVDVSLSDLKRWTKANSISVTTDGDGVVETISSTSKDETATIVGNVLSTIAKIVPVAFGVPVAKGVASTQVPDCGFARQRLEKIADLRRRLLTDRPNKDVDEALSNAIARLRESVTITIKKTIDPSMAVLRTELVEVGKDVDPTGTRKFGILAEIGPSPAMVEQKGWYNAAAVKRLTDNGFLSNVTSYRTYVAIDLAAVDTRSYTAVVPGSHYREPTLLEVSVIQGTGVTEQNVPKAPTIDRKSFHIPQIGQLRSIPLEAQIFESNEWSITFGPDGFATKREFSSQARGVAASSLLLNSAEAIGGTITSLRGVGQQRLQNELSRLKVQHDLLDYRLKLKQLEEKLGAAP